jgi:ribosome-binding protein aMBF1 (putative translation factor)
MISQKVKTRAKYRYLADGLSQKQLPVTTEHKAAASDQEHEARRAKLAEAIRSLRYEKELTSRGLAATSGISQSKISKIETGQQIPTAEDITKLATALRLPSGVADELVREAHARKRVPHLGYG